MCQRRWRSGRSADVRCRVTGRRWCRRRVGGDGEDGVASAAAASFRVTATASTNTASESWIQASRRRHRDKTAVMEAMAQISSLVLLQGRRRVPGSTHRRTLGGALMCVCRVPPSAATTAVAAAPDTAFEAALYGRGESGYPLRLVCAVRRGRSRSRRRSRRG